MPPGCIASFPLRTIAAYFSLIMNDRYTLNWPTTSNVLLATQGPFGTVAVSGGLGRARRARGEGEQGLGGRGHGVRLAGGKVRVRVGDGGPGDMAITRGGRPTATWCLGCHPSVPSAPPATRATAERGPSEDRGNESTRRLSIRRSCSACLSGLVLPGQFLGPLLGDILLNAFNPTRESLFLLRHLAHIKSLSECFERLIVAT